MSLLRFKFPNKKFTWLRENYFAMFDRCTSSKCEETSCDTNSDYPRLVDIKQPLLTFLSFLIDRFELNDVMIKWNSIKLKER